MKESNVQNLLALWINVHFIRKSEDFVWQIQINKHKLDLKSIYKLILINDLKIILSPVRMKFGQKSQ